jgi:hypothetical protein
MHRRSSSNEEGFPPFEKRRNYPSFEKRKCEKIRLKGEISWAQWGRAAWKTLERNLIKQTAAKISRNNTDLL